ncbi:MAG: class I SAM-dependent methyltransferase [Anaerolineae bacterium]|nr:class I SAM-dependent methyltransferase [Anaerolineae bacterium]
MEEDFKQAWEVHFTPRKPDLSDEQIAAYEQFALSNRKRAAEFIKSVQADLNYTFKDKRVLDIGSAYGGFVILTAQLAAKAYGVEILQYLHDLALTNAEHEPGFIKLINMDILDEHIFSEIENRPFDLIIVNDVFEHIYTSTALFRRIRELSHHGTILYFAIPNGEAWQSIENEGHLFKFGISLLEPGAWPRDVNPFNIYYRPIEYYQLHFQYAGFRHLYIKVEENALSSCKDRIVEKFSELEQKITNGSFVTNYQNNHGRHKFELLNQRLQEILKQNDLLKLHLSFDQSFWVGYATSEINPNLEDKTDLIRIDLDTFHMLERKRLKRSWLKLW